MLTYTIISSGAPVEVGDRVLLANKGEHGKWKLADNWENAIYLVVGMNADSHTFKIQHSSTGQEKTVHRNLITPVNFLPLPDAVSEDRMDMSDMSESEDLSEGQNTEADVDTSLDATEYRTRVWVSEMLSEGTSDMIQDDDDGQSLGAQDSLQLNPALVPLQPDDPTLPDNQDDVFPTPKLWIPPSLDSTQSESTQEIIDELNNDNDNDLIRIITGLVLTTHILPCLILMTLMHLSPRSVTLQLQFQLKGH